MYVAKEDIHGSRSCHRQREHADAHPLHSTEGIGTSRSSGTGGQHIIHKQDMLPGKAFGTAQQEDAVHVLPPFISRFASLRLCMPLSEHGSGVHGDARHGSNTAGYVLALVVSALLLPAGMQRDGDNHIDAVEESGSQQLGSHAAPHNLSQIFSASILQLMEDAAEIAPFIIEEERGGTPQGHFTPEHALCLIVFIGVIVRPGHVDVALHADTLFALLQSSPAHGALPRKEEVDKG